MSEYGIGIIGTVAVTLYVEVIIGLLVVWWADWEDADGEEKEEWTDTPGVIRFTTVNKDIMEQRDV